MATFDSPAKLLDTLSAPLGDIISSVGRGVADAQQALDAQTIENFKTIYDYGSDYFKALRELGYQPTWYQIPEATAQISIALTISGEASAVPGEPSALTPTSPNRVGRVRLYGAPVDAGYASRYNYDLRASSTLKFRIVPVPPSTQASGMKVMPNLIGSTLGDATALLEQLDIPYSIEPAGVEGDPEAPIVGTAPEGGGMVLPDQGAVLEIELPTVPAEPAETPAPEPPPA